MEKDKCPKCNSKKLSKVPYRTMDGKVKLVKFRCNNCNYISDREAPLTGFFTYGRKEDEQKDEGNNSDVL